MAMTKAERAYVEKLETALALRWPPYDEPKPMSSDDITAQMVELAHRRAAIGWFFNAYTGSISQGWSTGRTHNRDDKTGRNGSQYGGTMYQTKREAAMVCRIRMSQDFAAKLAAMDRIIQE